VDLWCFCLEVRCIKLVERPRIYAQRGSSSDKAFTIRGSEIFMLAMESNELESLFKG
jgi:hypothetical protein